MPSTTRSRADVIGIYAGFLPQFGDEIAKQKTAQVCELRVESVGRYLRERNLSPGVPKSSSCNERSTVDGAGTIRSWKPLNKKSPADLWRERVTANELAGFDEESARHVSMEFPDNLPIGIAWIADAHIDDPRARLSCAETDAQLIANTEGLYLAHGGDPGNYYLKTIEKLPHFDDAELPMRERLALIQHWLEMTIRKALLYICGGHEYYLYGRSGILFERGIMDDRNVHYSKDYALADISVGSESYLCYFTHEHWGASKLNPFNELLRAARHSPSAIKPDVVATAHRHDGGTFSDTIDGRKVVGMKSGSYKANAADFEGQRGIPESAWEMPMCILLPDEHKVLPFDSIAWGSKVLGWLRREYKERVK